MNYFFQVCGTCLLVSILSFILPISFYKILAPNLWNDILVCLVCVLSVIACVYLVGLTSDEKKLAKAIFNNKILTYIRIKR
jgi:membrane protease YdiL (CAAX protease family)